MDAIGLDATREDRRGGDPGEVFACYAALTKPRQTALLMATAAGAYLMTARASADIRTFALGMAALALTVSGSTAYNMVVDRDIDAKMARTADRPLPSGAIDTRAALVFASVLTVTGLLAAWAASPLFTATVAAGLAFDVVVYTMLLKRRTPLSILVGGVSGGMPAVAGRALALGRIDAVAVLLGLGVVLWIPAHILTLAMKHADEYAAAGVPVWPLVHGERSTQRLIAVATIGAASVLLGAGVAEGVHGAALVVLAAAGAGMIVLAAFALVRPSERVNWVLFKSASAYMLVAFACLTIGAFA